METDLVSLSRGIFIVQLLFTRIKAVRPPPQNSAKAKKLGGDQLPVKPDGSTNNQWG